MPQISKIRIVNFNYNDGNRFIPDELYDLASPDTGKALNTLFNLNNGGGNTGQQFFLASIQVPFQQYIRMVTRV